MQVQSCYEPYDGDGSEALGLKAMGVSGTGMHSFSNCTKRQCSSKTFQKKRQEFIRFSKLLKRHGITPLIKIYHFSLQPIQSQVDDTKYRPSFRIQFISLLGKESIKL